MCLSFNIDFISFFTKIDSISNSATSNSIPARPGVIRLEFEKNVFQIFALDLCRGFCLCCCLRTGFCLSNIFRKLKPRLDSCDVDICVLASTAVARSPLSLPGDHPSPSPRLHIFNETISSGLSLRVEVKSLALNKNLC